METNNKKEQTGLSPLHQAIRNFLALNDIDKFTNMKIFGFEIPQEYDNLHDVDLSFFTYINENNLRNSFIELLNPQQIETPPLSPNKSVEEAAKAYPKGGVEEAAFYVILNSISEAPHAWDEVIPPFVSGAIFGAQWKGEQSGWVRVDKVVEVLERYRINAVKLKSHGGDYAENVLYHIIEEIEDLPTPPKQ